MENQRSSPLFRAPPAVRPMSSSLTRPNEMRSRSERDLNSARSHGSVPLVPQGAQATARQTSVLRWCHHCRAKKYGSECRNTAVPARSGVRICKKVFCMTCLERYYGEPFQQVMDNLEWHCPYCRNSCKCSHCNDTRNAHSPARSHTPNNSADRPRSVERTPLETNTDTVDAYDRERQDQDFATAIAEAKRSISQVGQELETVSHVLDEDRVRNITNSLQSLDDIFTEFDTLRQGANYRPDAEEPVPVFRRRTRSSISISNLIN
eukprot:GILK01013418.1.p1 GENE.GILK01013418.1~~GILK01013418.1.p1  ORF type:complete len:283 (-),score=3.68 GILK01013418.1:149-940(-)